MENQLKSRSGEFASLNVAKWGPIPDDGVFMRTNGNQIIPFYVNNMTDANITTCSGIGSKMDSEEGVLLRPGWNEYIFKSLTVPAGITALQWGE